MPRLSIALAVIVVGLSGSAWAQQPSPSPEVQQKCRQEVRKLCNFLVPTKAAIRDCIAENKDKLSEQCLSVLSAAQK